MPGQTTGDRTLAAISKRQVLGGLAATSAAIASYRLYHYRRWLMDMQARFDAYLARLSGGSALAATTTDRQLVANWIALYAPATITDRNLPHLVGVAHHAMEAAATQSITDLGIATIHDALVANPARPVWGSCGSSVEWMMFCLKAFGFHSQDTSLWSAINNGHNIVEFWHPAFDKIVVYDPLYATIILDDRGVPASLSEIMSGSPPSSAWDIQPCKLNGVSSFGNLTCNNAAVQGYETYDYNDILDDYFQVVARKFQFFDSVGSPSLNFQDYVPGLSGIRGVWQVFDNYRRDNPLDFWNWFSASYAADGGNGTYLCRKWNSVTLNRFCGAGDIAGMRELRPLWQRVDGTVQIKTTSVATYNLAVKLALGWTVLGSAEIDHDGTDDIVVMSPAGDVHAWLTKDGAFAGAGMIGRLPVGTDLSTVEMKRSPFGPPALAYLDGGAVRRLPLKFGLFQ